MYWRGAGLIYLSCLSLLGAAQSVDKQLDRQIRAKTDNFHGKVTLFAKNLNTGATYSLDGSQPVRTASTIKLPIMIECFFEASESKLDLAEPLKVTSDEKVSGSGLLQEMSDGDQLPLRDMIDLMIVLSDNTATNLILNRIGGDAVNGRMEKLGLPQTRVMRKILGDRNDLKPMPSGITAEGAKPENKQWGLGRSSPQEMVALLEKLYRGEIISKSVSDEMLTILKRQRDHQGLGRDMKDVTIANKSGALDHLRSDVGIIYAARGPIAIAVTIDEIPEINWTPDNPAELLISSLSETLIAGL